MSAHYDNHPAETQASHYVLASPYEPLSQQASDLSTGQVVTSMAMNPVPASWNRPDATKDAASKMVLPHRIGAFVVYGKDSNTMAIKLQHGVQHFHITRLDSSPPRFRLELDDKQPWHMNLVSLVEYYQTPRDNVKFVLWRDTLPQSPKKRIGSKSSVASKPSKPLVQAGEERLQVVDFVSDDGFDFTRRVSARTAEDLATFRPTLILDD